MNPREIESYLKGNFELDCPIIELVPVVTCEKKPTLSGSGFISLNDAGYFDLKVYFPQAFSIKETLERLNWEAGKIIGDEFYYNLVAHDLSGKKWCAERFIPERNTGPNGSMITGKLPELQHTEEIDFDKEKYSLKFFFNETIKVPLNTVVKEEQTVVAKTRKLKTGIRLARFEAIDIEFEIDVTEGYTILSAASDKIEFTDILINRIFEAFCFVVAHSELWSILMIRNDGAIEYRVRAEEKNKKVKSRIHAPLDYQNHPVASEVWLLFDKYLQYTFANKSDKNHPISLLFYSIMESGKASLDVEALTLSVSIESLLSSELSDIYELSQELKNDIQCLSELIKKSGGLSNNFRQRMFGTISSMKKARAKDILIILRDIGSIDKELIKTYADLRNKTAHGVRNYGADIQNFLNQTSAVLVLFYQLVFLIIKYEGMYTDYGTYQYPTKQFTRKLL